MNYFQSNGHLSEEGIARYAEALKLDKVSDLPADLYRHIEQCDDCHRQALDLYAIIADFDYSAVALPPPPAKQATLRRIWVNRALLAAASVAALIWIINLLWQPGAGHIEQQSPRVVTNDTIPQNTPAPPTKTPIAPPQMPKQQTPPVKELIAANFEPSETLEGLLNDATRSETINVTGPANGTTFAPGQAISFAWAAGNDNTAQLQVVVVNNQNKQQYRLDAGSEGLTFAGKLNPGIYYWKLENETDLLYVGMFFIR